MIYATDVSTYYVACKKGIPYVAVPEIELSDSVSLSVTAPTHSLSPSVVRGTSNCDIILQCVKHRTLSVFS